MNNKLFQIILSLLCFYVAYKIIIIKKFMQRGYQADFSSPYVHWPIGMSFVLFGLLIIYNSFFNKPKKQIDFSKCPKCKESYTYSNLKEGLCPRCKIKTIQTDEYLNKGDRQL